MSEGSTSLQAGFFGGYNFSELVIELDLTKNSHDFGYCFVIQILQFCLSTLAIE